VAKPIARVWGTALVPGVSRNGRLYTAEHVRRMVAAAQPTLAAGDLTLTKRDGDAPPPDPIGTRSHHAADDDSLRLLGRVTALTLNERDEALFELDLANTSAGRDLLELIDTEDGPAFLSGVSIRGYWGSEPREIEHEGQRVTTGDDLILQGLDFTQSPGVPGAGVSRVERLSTTAPRESAVASGRAIRESVQEAHVTTAVTETASSVQPPDVVYADNAYLPDRVKRYPLDTRRGAVEAWTALTTTETARDYTAAQLKRARARTAKALEGHGVTVTTEGYMRTERAMQGAVTEMWPSVDGDGGYCIALHIGPLRVEVASYAVDPHDLDRISRAAASAAADALRAVMADPDATLDAGSAMPVEGGKPAFPTNDDETEEAMANSTDEDERAAEEAAKKPMPAFIRDKIKKREDADDSDDEDEDDAPAKGKGKVPASFAAHQFKAKGDKAGDDEDDEDDDEPKAKKKARTSNAKETAVADSITETAEQRKARLVAEGIAAAVEHAEVTRLIAEGIAAANAPKETEQEMVARLVAEGLAAAQPKETDEQRIARLVQEGVAAGLTAAVQTHVEHNGAPQRTGLVNTPGTAATESTGGLPADWPTMPDGTRKAVHQLTESERGRYATPMLADYVESELKRHRARAIGLG
jgi:hypothetical protein